MLGKPSQLSPLLLHVTAPRARKWLLLAVLFLSFFLMVGVCKLLTHNALFGFGQTCLFSLVFPVVYDGSVHFLSAGPCTCLGPFAELTLGRLFR